MERPDKQKMKKIENFARAVAENPNSAKARVRLGTALIQNGAVKKAEVELRKAIELDADCAEAWMNLGGVFMSRWDFASCVDANLRALKLKPDHPTALFNLGLAYLYLKKPEEMVSCFEKVVVFDPTNADAHYHLAVGQLALGRLQEAQLSAAKASRLGHTLHPDFLRELDRKLGRGASAALQGQSSLKESTH